MFRKLVSNLPFSPALVGQLGFYAKRLKREEATRRLGLVFTALALIVQSFAVITPPESANASSAADFIYGGVTSKQQLLSIYDRSARGNGDFEDLATYAGITRAEIEKTKETTINSRQYGTGNNAWVNWTRTHRFGSAEGEVKHSVPRSNGGVSSVYSYPLWRHDSTSFEKKYGSTYQAFVGYSAKIGTFAIIKDCGNIITRVTPAPAPEAVFVQATCETIRGYAYDSRNKGVPVAVYLYFNGPPGKGEKLGPIVAKGENNSFSISVPDKFQKSRSASSVTGVMVPLAGWGQSTVQFKNSLTVPGNCAAPTLTPSASCVGVKAGLIGLNQFTITATGSATNGARIQGYTYVVKDSTGKVVFEKRIDSSATSLTSDKSGLQGNGDYSVSVVVHTSLGDRTSASCTTTINTTNNSPCTYDSSLPSSSPDCQPCPDDKSISSEDASCAAIVVESKEARNLTRNMDAQSVTADSGDRIQYSVFVENVGKTPATFDINEQLGDVMEYATIQHAGGGTYDKEKEVLSWKSITLSPGERQTRSFVVSIKDEVPATPQGTSDPNSYNCIMTNSFGTTVNIKVNCPQVKMIEQTVKELPSTGAGGNMIFAAILASFVTFLWARSRQLKKEVRLIRKEFNMGTI